MSTPEGMEELQGLMDEIRQLRAENEQLKSRRRSQDGATHGSTSNSESHAPSAASSSEQSTSNNASEALVHTRYVYVPRERKCSKFTGKLSRPTYY